MANPWGVRKLLAGVIAALLIGAVVPAMAATRTGSPSSAPYAPTGSSAAPTNTFSAGLTDLLRTTPKTASLGVIVRGDSLAAARGAAEAHGLQVAMTFPRVSAVVASGPASGVAALRRAKGVRYVEADRRLDFFDETSNLATRGQEVLDGFTGTRTVETTTPCPSRAKEKKKKKPCPPTTTSVMTTAASAPVDGSGVTVAIVDSGIDGTHPMFADADGTSRVVRNLRLVCTLNVAPGAYDCNGPAGDANDDVFVDLSGAGPANDTDTISGGGHGTHVAGIAGGGQVTTSDGREFHGAAPGVKIVGLSVGQAISVSGAAAGLNWVLEHHAQPCGPDVPAADCPAIKVVNNSYGTTGDYDPESIDAQLGEALVAEGVVMVWANGNGDELNDGGTGADNRSNPPGQSPVPGVISVANYDDGGTGTRDGSLDSSSSRGEATRRETFPDLSAPGTDITSACKPTLTICRTLPGPDPDPYYGTISGTSMATPHVVGIVAQLIQAGRQEGVELTPGQIEDVLEDTAYKFAFGAAYQPDLPERNDGTTSFDKGHGLVDAKAAVARIRKLTLAGEGGPAASPCVGGVIVVDPSGDGTDPSVDVTEVTMAWDDTAKALTTTIHVADLQAAYPATYNGQAFYVDFVRDGHPYFVSGERSMFEEAGSFSLGRPDPNASNLRTALSSAGMSGSFDDAADTITIVLKQAAIDEANATLDRRGHDPAAAADQLRVPRPVGDVEPRAERPRGGLAAGGRQGRERLPVHGGRHLRWVDAGPPAPAAARRGAAGRAGHGCARPALHVGG